MKKNTLFVILFAMLCLGAITAVVSADNDGYNSYCFIDQYGCWVTDWDKELDEPTGKKIYVQFWSEEAREFFMGKDSDATVAPLPRKYGATMTMVKGDEAARGAWKSGLWGFEVYDAIGWRAKLVSENFWEFVYENNNGERVNYADYTLENTYYPTLTVTYYTGDGRQKVGTQVYYLEHPEIGKGKKFEDFEAYAEFIDKNLDLKPYGVYNYYITIDGEEFPYEDAENSSFEKNYIAKAKDGASDIVVKYCNDGHIVDGFDEFDGIDLGWCVLPGSLIRDIDDVSDVSIDDSGWFVNLLTDSSGNIIFVDENGNYNYDWYNYNNDVVVIDHVIWANPWY